MATLRLPAAEKPSRKAQGPQRKAGEAGRWTRAYFEKLGLRRLRGTAR
jgi:hypothetical protein